jgi:hypothetical protein
LVDTIDRYHATSVSVNSSSSTGSRAPNSARPRLDDAAEPGKFRRVHHVLGPDFYIDREVIADSHQPRPLLRCARISTSPRIRLRPKAGFGGQKRGEVKKALHRQSILLRQFLQRGLRPRADDTSLLRQFVEQFCVGGIQLLA